jgi:hypothetical protein
MIGFGFAAEQATRWVIGMVATFAAGVVLLFGVAAVLWLALEDAWGRGQCVGWADAQGLVAGWDSDGRCVIGSHPATEDGR